MFYEPGTCRSQAGFLGQMLSSVSQSSVSRQAQAVVHLCIVFLTLISQKGLVWAIKDVVTPYKRGAGRKGERVCRAQISYPGSQGRLPVCWKPETESVSLFSKVWGGGEGFDLFYLVKANNSVQ